MKKIIIIVLLIGINTLINAQIEFSEAPRSLNDGTYNSLQFSIPEGGKELATKEWQKLMSGFQKKTKYKRKSKSWETKGVSIPQVNSTAVDVFAQVLGNKKSNVGTTMIVWLKTNDSYLNSEEHPEQTTYFKDLLSEYATNTSIIQAQTNANAEEKRLSDMDKQLIRLRKDAQNYASEISKAREIIAKNEKNLEVNALDQQTMEAEIATQKIVVKTANDQIQQYKN